MEKRRHDDDCAEGEANAANQIQQSLTRRCREPEREPQQHDDRRRAGRERILGFHVCDWLVPTTDLLLDRGMMGDGVIDLPQIRGWVEGAGFDGYTEVEIMSAQNWWKRDPDEVVTVCLERMQTIV